MQNEQALTPQEGKQRVLTKTRSSATRSISGALVMKSDRIFFLCERDGSVPDEGGHGLGLYYDDTRYLRAYDFQLCGQRLDLLAANDEAGDKMEVLLTNPDVHEREGELLPKESISVILHRRLDGEGLRLHDSFRIENYLQHAVDVAFSLVLKPDFASVFEVRGMLDDRPGKFHAASRDGTGLSFAYDGADGWGRAAGVRFEPAPEAIEDGEVRFALHLEARGAKSIDVWVDVDERRPEGGGGHKGDAAGDRATADREAYLGNRTAVSTTDEESQKILDRSFRDLRMLQTRIDGETCFAAGLPWFVTIFGRDSVVTALETLAFNPLIAEQTLLLIAKYQGRSVDEWTEEQPGKVLHELRRDELTNIGDLPYRPYYGTVDATPLFLLLLARHARWTGSLDVFERLRDNVNAALRWIDEYGDSDGDGYLDYETHLSSGLINEGWKDSSDAMVTEAGHLAEPPIAPAEVQGYVFAAKRELAETFEQAGDGGTADRLRKEAEELRTRFNRDYWLPEKQIYAMGMEKGGRPLAVVSSNAGHVLWSGIADDDKAAMTARRLMEEDMFSGWGVRTLSTAEARYSPVSYHLGSVWPHDNAIILGGLRGLDREAAGRIFESMLEAGRQFPNARLPELFCGFDRSVHSHPIPYPVACHPQAWAAGSVPYMLEQSLGLKADGYRGLLAIEHPALPDSLPEVDLEHLKAGGGECHLRFTRLPQGDAQVEVVSARGVQVRVEAAT